MRSEVQLGSLIRIGVGVIAGCLFVGLVLISGVAVLLVPLALYAGLIAVAFFFKPGELRLDDGEKIVWTTTPSGPDVWIAYAFTLGLYEFWRRANRLTVTHTRVVYQSGLLTKTERTLPLHFIQDVTVRHVLWSGRVTLSTAGGAQGLENFGPLWPAQARTLKDTIVAYTPALRTRSAPVAASSAPAPASSAGTSDVVERLRSLAALHGDGTLTSAEFEAAKAQVLQG